jgi:hypothetical protein
MTGGRGAHPHHVHRAVLELGETILAEPALPRILKLAAEVVAAEGVHALLSGITATIHRGQQVIGVLTGRSKKPRAFTAMQVHFVEDAAIGAAR